MRIDGISYNVDHALKYGKAAFVKEQTKNHGITAAKAAEHYDAIEADDKSAKKEATKAAAEIEAQEKEQAAAKTELQKRDGPVTAETK